MVIINYTAILAAYETASMPSTENVGNTTFPRTLVLPALKGDRRRTHNKIREY